VSEEEREVSTLYSNHSCNANLDLRGEFTFVGMRNIQAGEELTHDWALPMTMVIWSNAMRRA
jgi:SET domain-containing protein